MRPEIFIEEGKSVFNTWIALVQMDTLENSKTKYIREDSKSYD